MMISYHFIFHNGDLTRVKSSIFIELLVSGIASVVYKINGRQ